MGFPKVLLPYENGSIIRCVAQKALQVETAGVIIVANPAVPKITDQVNDLPVILVWNEMAHLGMSTSLVKGIERVPNNASAIVVMLADQPEIEPFVLRKVINQYMYSSASIIQASYSGKPGHPVLFDRKWFPSLLQTIGDQGAKHLIQAAGSEHCLVNFDYPPLEDIDTKEDYERLIKRSIKKGGCD